MVFLKRILAYMPGSILVGLSDIEIEREDENRLVLNADGWLVTFDRSSGTVSYDGRLATSFASVDSIIIQHFINGKRLEWWILSLKLRTGKRLTIGRSTDSAQVSIAAAHAATIMVKDVRTIEEVEF
jgi:hypothetical protein